jgi:hypothetical protein
MNIPADVSKKIIAARISRVSNSDTCIHPAGKPAKSFISSFHFQHLCYHAPDSHPPEKRSDPAHELRRVDNSKRTGELRKLPEFYSVLFYIVR